MKLKIEPRYYMGSLQGHKVFINGKKYPRKHGHWYSTGNVQSAMNRAVIEIARLHESL